MTPDTNMADLDSMPDVNVLKLGLIVEGGMLGLALVLGWFGFHDQRQPLNQLDWEFGTRAIVWGLVATLPMLLFLVTFHFWRPAFFEPMRAFVETKIKPMFQRSTLFDFLVISLLAGLGEEMLFRWCLQGGITSVLETRIGLTAAVVVGLVAASVIFGICHWVNSAYGMTTIVIGAYLGAVMIWSGSWIVPAVAHALYDFVALIYISRLPDEETSAVAS